MFKSIIKTVSPRDCYLITSKKQKAIITKSIPKLEVPFKVYLYCAYGRKVLNIDGKVSQATYNSLYRLRNGEVVNKITDKMDCYEMQYLNGKVIGEFICNKIYIFGFSPYNHGEYLCSKPHHKKDILKISGYSFEDMFNYIGEDFGYGLGISDLVIYEKPKTIENFCIPNKERSLKEPLMHFPTNWLYANLR